MASEISLPTTGSSPPVCVPLFYADWMEVLFLHFEIAPDQLQPHVPFPLDLFDARAWVSLVLFTMRRFRPARGGLIARRLFRLLPEQRFMNVRTYVRCHGQAGIHFLAEWNSNRLCCLAAPRMYSLPYRLGRFQTRHHPANNRFTGTVTDCRSRLSLQYESRQTNPAAGWARCAAGGLEEFLLERYAAFNTNRRNKKSFRIWHRPWKQAPVRVESLDDNLLRQTFPWWKSARLERANYSPGAEQVWMGKPERIR